jgi:Ca2+:H+ antiporter
MSPTETTRLLENGAENGDYPEPNKPFTERAVAFFKAEGEPSWVDSYKYFWFGAWVNILLVFVPLSFIAHHLNWDAPLRFAFSFIAIMPLAKVSFAQRFLSCIDWSRRSSSWERRRTKCR